MDGCTITIDAILEDGQPVFIEFVQNMFIQITVEGKYAGQLYLNDEHVKPRSELQMHLVDGLKDILYRKGGMPWMEKVVLAEKIEYIESQNYLTDLEQMKNDLKSGE